MKLYEVNQQIETLLDQLEPDPETGEIPANEDEIIAQINALAMKREDILQYLAKLSLDAKATVQAMKAEEKRLHDRRAQMERKQEQLIAILDRECGGQKTDLGVATLCYRKTSHVEVTDKSALLHWLKTEGHDDCYRVPEPEISKLNVGRLLDAGVQVEGAERVQSTSCYLR
ncbi:MAG: siphovirus Gp157 family protein [Clostridia bacterium]|nr:siphovirus Gp157 family protein [Clostridia bacterium]